MTEMKFSVLHATLGRPHKAIAAMWLFHNRAQRPDSVEYILSVNHDDPTRDELSALLREAAKTLNFGRFFLIVTDALGSSAAWNAAAGVSCGALLIQGQDDVEPPQDWDALLLDVIRDNDRLAVNPKPFFIAVSDGYRKDDLCCTAVMSRAYMEMEGHFLFPGYLSVFSDDEVTYRALRNNRDDRSYMITARHITFLHRHHYHDKSVPWDETYARENSSHAYAVGERLFRERNPRAQTDGLRTWV